MYVKVCSSMLPCAYKLGSSCSCLDQGISIFCMHCNRNFGCRLSYNWLLKVLIRLFYTFLHPLLTADEVSGGKWQLVIARSWFATLWVIVTRFAYSFSSCLLWFGGNWQNIWIVTWNVSVDFFSAITLNLNAFVAPCWSRGTVWAERDNSFPAIESLEKMCVMILVLL